MNPNGLSAKGRKQLADFESALLVSADSNARRQAILYEVAAVATRYEQDITPEDGETRRVDLLLTLGTLGWASSVARQESVLIELAGRCVAWLEHLATTEAKT